MAERMGVFFVLLAGTAVQAGDGTWQAAGGGTWSEPTHWEQSVPDGRGDVATFGMWLPSSDATVVLSGPVVVGAIDYHNLDRLVLGGPGPLVLSPWDGEPARITLHELAYELRVNAALDTTGAKELIAEVDRGGDTSLGRGSCPGPGQLDQDRSWCAEPGRRVPFVDGYRARQRGHACRRPFRCARRRNDRYHRFRRHAPI